MPQARPPHQALRPQGMQSKLPPPTLTACAQRSTTRPTTHSPSVPRTGCGYKPPTGHQGPPSETQPRRAETPPRDAVAVTP
eukprot:scaffold53_cov362-Prasinococcus_capsulatus_cf.AAC.7